MTAPLEPPVPERPSFRWIAGLALVACAAAVLWIAWQGGQHSPELGAPGAQLPSTPGRPIAVPSVAERPASRTVATRNDVGREDGSEPVAAFGWVESPDPALRKGLDVALFDCFGEAQQIVAPDEKGSFQLRSGRALLAGWSVATLPSGRGAALSGLATLLAVRANLPAHAPGSPAVECHLVLGPPPMISGQVVDRRSGEPIEDAEVFAVTTLAPWREESEDAALAQDGTFSLEITQLPASALFVGCRASERAGALVGPLELSPGEIRRVDFMLEEAGTLRGRIVDASSGQPVPGAEVTLSSELYFCTNESADTMSGEDGSFELEAVELPLEKSRIKVKAEGYAPVAIRPTSPSAPMEIRLTSPERLTGRLVGGGGEPLGNVEIRLALASEWTWGEEASYDSTTSAADGAFTLVPESTPVDEAVVHIDSAGHQPFVAPVRDLRSRPSPSSKGEIVIVLEPVLGPVLKPQGARSRPASMR
jgi:carboxypeptidase family protein